MGPNFLRKELLHVYAGNQCFIHVNNEAFLFGVGRGQWWHQIWEYNFILLRLERTLCLFYDVRCYCLVNECVKSKEMEKIDKS